jgi:hypothetical protein
MAPVEAELQVEVKAPVEAELQVEVETPAKLPEKTHARSEEAAEEPMTPPDEPRFFEKTDAWAEEEGEEETEEAPMTRLDEPIFIDVQPLLPAP